MILVKILATVITVLAAITVWMELFTAIGEMPGSTLWADLTITVALVGGFGGIVVWGIWG